MANKRFYYLQLFERFFDYIIVKRLRREAAGAEYVLLYLQLIINTMNSNCHLYYEEVCPTISEEIALSFNMPIEYVRGGLEKLIEYGLVETCADGLIVYEPNVPDILRVGSETDSARRMQRKRNKHQIETSHCDAGVTQCDADTDTDAEIDAEIDADVTAIIIHFNRTFHQNLQKEKKQTIKIVRSALEQSSKRQIEKIIDNEYRRYVGGEYHNVSTGKTFFPTLTWICGQGLPECQDRLNAATTVKNQFNNYMSRGDYDFNVLERDLISNQ